MLFRCYKITCAANGKLYIGVTSKRPKERWAGHLRDARNGSKNAFHAAIRKHGKDAFSVEVVEEFLSKGAAFAREIELISLLGTMAPKGYNMTRGGEGCIGLSDDSKLAKSQSAKAAHAKPEVKARHLAGVLASITDARNLKISVSKTGKPMHPNAKAGIAEAKKTDRCRLIASKAASKVWSKPGYKEKWQAGKLEKHINKAAKFPQREDGLIFSSTRAAASYMQKNGWPKAAANNIALACRGDYKSSCGFAWSWVAGDTARKIGGIIT